MTDERDFTQTKKKLIRNFSNGVIHNLMLWIISKENIHGYAIMKRLEEFFNISHLECEIKISSSKIYPILSKMEEVGVIEGEWKVNENNKSVKYYSITDDGLELLSQIQDHMSTILTSPTWLAFIKDMTGLEVINECDRNS